MAELPSGTVTFLFTDLEGSTRLWDEQPEAIRGALARHDDIVRGAIRPTAATSSRPLATASTRCSQLRMTRSMPPSPRKSGWKASRGMGRR